MRFPQEISRLWPFSGTSDGLGMLAVDGAVDGKGLRIITGGSEGEDESFIRSFYFFMND